MEAILWILLMFTTPDEASGRGRVKVLKVYTSQSLCQEDETRALSIRLPPGAMVTCISTKRPTLT